MSDLVRGQYPLRNSATKLTGAMNATQGNLAARSNLEWPIGSLQDAAAALVTANMTLVAVPVEFGDVYTFVDVLVGATAAGTPTHSWAALYTGTATTATLVGVQAVDGGSAAIAASTRKAFALGAPYEANPTDSPNGYIYVGIGVTATTVPSLVSGTAPTATQQAYYTGQPKFAATIAAAGATAPATVTLASTSAIAVPPVVVLR